MMIRWIESLDEWDGTPPAVLLLSDASRDRRQHVLRNLVAKALRLGPAVVEIEQFAGRPPVVTRPLGSGLYLSEVERGRFTAIAVARSPVGVAIEVADFDAPVTSERLHPIESAFLEPLAGKEKVLAFARLCSIKDAYSHARGQGLSPLPSRLAVQFVDEERAAISDPTIQNDRVEAGTIWRGLSDRWAAVSAVTIGRQPS